jgi:GNAT superfamily N-acetyltransferase
VRKVSDLVLKQADRLGKANAADLIAAVWAELLGNGHAPTYAIPFRMDDKVVWLESEGVPVAILTYTIDQWSDRIWINFAGVSPAWRKQGCYRRLYAEIIRIAQENKLSRVASGVEAGNLPMQEAAVRLGRRAEWTCYVQDVPSA